MNNPWGENEKSQWSLCNFGFKIFYFEFAVDGKNDYHGEILEEKIFQLTICFLAEQKNRFCKIQ